MTIRFAAFTASIFLLVFAGCRHPLSSPGSAPDRSTTDQLARFQAAPVIEVFSLAPAGSGNTEEPATCLPRPTPLRNFHGFSVLGSFKAITVADLDTVREAARALTTTGSGAFCFNARHGLRIHSSGSHIDVVICYECGRAKVYTGQSPSGELFFGMPADQPTVSPSGLNKLLRAHSIPQPRGPAD